MQLPTHPHPSTLIPHPSSLIPDDFSAYALKSARAPVAQWIEQSPPKGQVARSIRVRGAIPKAEGERRKEEPGRDGERGIGNEQKAERMTVRP